MANKKDWKKLRKEAEKILEANPEKVSDIDGATIREIIQELHVHQIELEMQNEALQKSQENLEISEQKYRDLFENAPIGYFVCDQKGIIKEANAGFTGIVQEKRANLIGTSFQRFCTTEYLDTFHLLLNKVRLSEKASCELDIKNGQGTIVSLYIQSRLVPDLDNKKVFRIALFDITEKKKMENKLRTTLEELKQANEAKRIFLANMSHEVRTPMNAIVGFTNLLLKGCKDKSQEKQFLTYILESGELLTALIDDILQYSKIESGTYKIKISSFAYREVIENIKREAELEIKKSGKNIQIVNAIPEGQTGPIYADPLRFYQVYSNLVNNAVKYTREGEITLTAEKIADGQVLFSIIDTGIGINKDILPAIFNPFIQADSTKTKEFRGVGLGLTIAKKLVELMGGKMGVTSKTAGSGRGTRFFFTLNLAETETDTENENENETRRGELREPEKPVITHKEVENLKILVAEDNALNALLFKMIFEKQNYQVLFAHDGEEAVELFKNNSDINLIFMDVHMPKVNGLEAAREIRLLEKSSGAKQPVTILALSAAVYDSDRKACLEAGMDGFVEKPVTEEKLFEAIDTLCSP